MQRAAVTLYSKICLVALALSLVLCVALPLSSTSVAQQSANAMPAAPAPAGKLSPALLHADTTQKPGPAVNMYNWSGYAAYNVTFTKTQSWFVVPKAACTVPHAQVSIWSGLGGYQDGTVEQAGVDVNCGGSKGTTPDYYAWWEMWPTNIMQRMPLTVQPGDAITVNVNYISGSYLLQVVNGTRHATYSKTVACAVKSGCSRASAEWVVERPLDLSNKLSPLADWGTIRMYSSTAATTHGLQPISSFTYNALNMVNNTNATLATVTTLDPTGKIFSDYWKQAQ